jgi:signal transduction histidine kinase/CheY-like chemotaxis protein/HPt (histidine-containing phosphotransfer) domain-containing protein
MSGRIRVLLVEDDPADAMLVHEMLRSLDDNPFELSVASTLAEARRHLVEQWVDVVIADLGLPDSFGIATLTALQQAAGDIPLVTLTGHNDERFALEAMKHGAQDYLVKGRGDGAVLARVLQYAIERKLAAIALRDSQARFRDYAASSSDWFWETDSDVRFTYVSSRFKVATGAPESWVVGKRWPELLREPGAFIASGATPGPAALPRQQAFRDVELELPLPAGSAAGTAIVLRISGVPVSDGRGTFIGYRGTASDITEQRAVREALREAKERAEAGIQVKSSFLAIMGHEVRTPLQGIIGMAELLRGEALGERPRKWVDTIVESSELLLTVLNDILDFSRLEAGRLPLERAPFSLAGLVDSVASLMGPQALESGLNFFTRIDPALFPTMVGDSVRLRQILLNLVSNALKFTPAGSVGIEVTVLAASAGEQTVRVEVSDTGIGISEAGRAQLFTEFTQLGTANSRAQTGSGLGLAICKRLIDLMRGRIGVAGNEDGGSRFWIELTLEKSGEAAPPVITLPIAASLPPQRILVVDDHEVNRMVAGELLHRAGHTVTSVDSGPAALAILAEGRFDVVLLDMMMPGMDGEETTRRIRAMKGAAARVPLIAFTARQSPEDKQRWRDAGFDGFVGKPLRLPAFATAVMQATAVIPPPSTALPPGPAVPLSGLVAEDDMADDVAVLGPDYVERLLAVFCDTGACDLAELRRALWRGDTAQAVGLAHRLGSASSSLHLRPLSEHFRRAERAALNHDAALAQAALTDAERLWPVSIADLRMRLRRAKMKCVGV